MHRLLRDDTRPIMLLEGRMCLRPCNMKPLLDCEAEGTAGTMPAWVASFSAPAHCGAGSLQDKKLPKKMLR